MAFLFHHCAVLLICFALFFFVNTVQADAVDDAISSNPLVQATKDPETLRRLRALRQDVQAKGCNVNICFAIQGDNFIPSYEFFDQVNFLDLIANILTTDEPGGLCAVQYGRLTTPISPLTDNRIKFANRLDATYQVGGDHSNMAAALGYAAFQLRPRIEDANKIVLFADGFESVGMSPTDIAKRIREDNIEICAVGVGDYSVAKLQDIVGSPEGVLKIDGYFELLEIISALIYGVCGI